MIFSSFQQGFVVWGLVFHPGMLIGCSSLLVTSWLTALPLIEYGFTLHKGTFHDALALQYGWTPSKMPAICSCGSSFTAEHTLSCARGVFPIIKHNEIRDLTATLLIEGCNIVKI